VTKRALTPYEKQKIMAHERAKAQAAHPGASIIIHVDDETDENGQAVVRVSRTMTTVMSSDWKPPHA
jgi:hypothetical protein